MATPARPATMSVTVDSDGHLRVNGHGLTPKVRFGVVLHFTPKDTAQQSRSETINIDQGHIGTAEKTDAEGNARTAQSVHLLTQGLPGKIVTVLSTVKEMVHDETSVS